MQRVQKILSNRGYCSRRKAEQLIQQGRVRVNSRIITIGDKASEDDQIYVDNKPVPEQKKVYIKFNKPAGCVTALADRHEKTVMDYINIKERVFPVGRLDKQTSGLLLLTNDGDFANRIMHPRYEIKKTYLAVIDRPMMKKHVRMIESGIKLEDGMTSPARVVRNSPQIVEITIHEGRNRIVRRILENLGFSVISLTRTCIGRLEIGGLPEGKYEFISEKQIKTYLY